VPVEFLTDEQRRLYGRFHGEPTLEDLARYFHLDDSDRSLIALHRGDHNRLGFAVQLCAVRYVGAFPEDLTETPAAVVSILGRQLSIEHANCFAEYCTSRQRWDHTVEIRERGGYVEFSDGSTQFRLNRWLYALCWTGTDRPGMLFDRATTWLITHKVLLPGATVLERHVSRIRARVQERLWSSLIRGASLTAKQKLDALLTVPHGGHQSLLDRLQVHSGEPHPSLSEHSSGSKRCAVSELMLESPIAFRPDAFRHSHDSPQQPRRVQFNAYSHGTHRKQE
jgi:Domain of unknown function (DUF4158)